jgi:hypothetical protein
MALTVIKPSGIDSSGNYTVTGMNVSANISVANLSVTTSANLGNVGNIIITGGTTGQVLSTNGSGGLSFISVSSSGISNGNSNVNIATANGNVTITSVGNTTMTVTGTGANVSGTLSVSGNATIGGNLITSGAGGGNITGANVVSANLFTGTLTTGAQPNITSTGTLTSLSVSGNIIGANVVSANLFTGTLTTNAQPNITSTGTLTSLSVTGNANIGNIGTTNLVATGAGSFGANVNMNTYWINNVGYPSLTTDVATKSYVDTMISTGIAYHQPVAVATTTTLAVATGGTTAYNSPNGAANGIGAYISTTGTYLNIDSANVQTVGTRILVKDEANATWNGIYTYANTTAIVRASDADEYGADSTEQLSINDYFFTQGGTVNKGIAYIVSAPAGTITFGTSNITFAQFSSSQVYSAGTGLTLTDTTFSVNASQTQITSVGTLTGLAVNGNITAANITANTGVFTGNGSGLSAIAGANVTGAVSFATTANSVAGANVSGAVGLATYATTANAVAGANVSGAVSFATTANSVAGGNVSGQVGNALIAGTVYTNAQPNITSVGTLTTLSVSGNATVGNIISGGGGGGNITGANLVSANYFTGVLTTNAQPNITSTGTLSSVSVSGNANIGDLSVSGVVRTNLIPVGNGVQSLGNATNLWSNLYLAGNTIYLGTSTIAANATSIILTNPDGGITVLTGNTGNSQISGQTLSVTGNATAGNLITGGIVSATGNGSFGNVNAGNLITANFTTAVITTGAQPNITSTGTLSSLSVSGTSNLGAVGNVTITGGTNGYVLSTNGSGSLSWVAQSGGGGGASISNGTSNVNIATSGGNVTTSVAGNANILTVTGTGANINGTLNVTGQTNLGAVGNVVITGGTANYVLKTDGAGTLSWTAQTAGSAANVTVDNFTGNGVQTAFVLSVTPIGINQTSVNYNGATVLRSDYTLLGSTITFSSAPANGSLLEITTINLTSGGGGASSAAAVGYSLIFGG